METFSDKTKDFVQYISDNVREIHKKSLEIKDFFCNFHRYNGTHTNIIII